MQRPLSCWGNPKGFWEGMSGELLLRLLLFVVNLLLICCYFVVNLLLICC